MMSHSAQRRNPLAHHAPTCHAGSSKLSGREKSCWSFPKPENSKKLSRRAPKARDSAFWSFQLESKTTCHLRNLRISSFAITMGSKQEKESVGEQSNDDGGYAQLNRVKDARGKAFTQSSCFDEELPLPCRESIADLTTSVSQQLGQTIGKACNKSTSYRI